MRRVLDGLRLVLMSPELVGALLPFVGYAYLPAWADVLVKPMKDGLAFGLGATAIPVGMLVFNYKESLDLLSPSGAGKVLLQWPDYPMLKARVVAALAWCVAGLIAVLIGVWLVAIDWAPRLAICILAAGILAASAASATIALARFRLREILVE